MLPSSKVPTGRRMFWTRDAYTFGSLGGAEARRRGTDIARGRLVLQGQGATGVATDPRDTRAAGRGRVSEASDKLLVLAHTVSGSEASDKNGSGRRGRGLRDGASRAQGLSAIAWHGPPPSTAMIGSYKKNSYVSFGGSFIIR